MKSGIHPEYVECTVRCSCGNTFKTHSTKSEIQVELCNECHPFYTGQQKFVDTGGRVQAALEREAAKKAAKQAAAEEAAAKKAAEREAKLAEKAKRAAEYEKKAAAEAAKKAEEAPAEETAAEAEVETEAAAE